VTQPTQPFMDTAKITGPNDPVLQELWAVKAQLNKQANYSVAEIVRRLNEQGPRLQQLRAKLAPTAH
jgi:hypothetical protein